jgi:hypothetical protein
MGSKDSPLAIHSLHSDRHRQLALMQKEQAVWVGLLALFPLVLLLLTGLYLFALPSAAKWRSG